MKRKRVVIVCPGRGTYTKSELGYLHRYHLPQKDQYIAKWNSYRTSLGLPSLIELDGAQSFDPKIHFPGENSSALIAACAISDFMDINLNKYEIVGVIGNSMGWYIAMACAQVLDENQSIRLIQNMGQMMRHQHIGAQLIYPVMNKDWQIEQKSLTELKCYMEEVSKDYPEQLFTSIVFGGHRVIGGSEEAIKKLMAKLPKIDVYPFVLPKNGAFHTPLMEEISQKAFQEFSNSHFTKPRHMIIDGHGRSYSPYSAQVDKLYNYTLSEQVCQTYNFSQSVQVAAKELAPEVFLTLGPGSNLGGAIIQSLIETGYKNIHSKKDFEKLQEQTPLLLAMGREDQRKILM